MPISRVLAARQAKMGIPTLTRVPLKKWLRGFGGRDARDRRLKRKMIRKAVKDEAEKIIRDYGADASRAVSNRLSTARRLRRARLREFLEQVARQVERQANNGRRN